MIQNSNLISCNLKKIVVQSGTNFMALLVLVLYSLTGLVQPPRSTHLPFRPMADYTPCSGITGGVVMSSSSFGVSPICGYGKTSEVFH